MLDSKLIKELQAFLNFHLHLEENAKEACNEELILKSLMPTEELEHFINQHLQPTLQDVLFSYIDQKGLTDVEVYKRAGIDRKHFSKIRSNPNYRPRKNTVLALALALELNRKETDKLLNTVGYSLSESESSDLIIQFFLEKNIHDLDTINQALHYFSHPTLNGT